MRRQGGQAETSHTVGYPRTGRSEAVATPVNHPPCLGTVELWAQSDREWVVGGHCVCWTSAVSVERRDGVGTVTVTYDTSNFKAVGVAYC